MKKEYTCANCGQKFYRYTSTVRNIKRVFCSKKCVYEYQKYALLGDNNPGYKTGKYCNKTCICGNPKDTRSNKCSECARKGFKRDTNRTPDGWALEIKSDEEIIAAVKECNSITAVSNYLNVSRGWVADRIKKLNINSNHFIKCSHRPNRKNDILCENSKVTHGTLRKFVLKHDLIEYICCECGQGSDWKGKPIILELHHINGNNRDNRLDNLVFLCPNCHTQTETHRGRKS